MAASGQVSLPAAVRATCITLAIENSPLGIHSSPPSSWLRLGSWEAFGGHSTWPDFPVVVESLGEYLSTVPGLPSETRVYYVCGSDHAGRCGLYSGALSSRGRSKKGQLPLSLKFMSQSHFTDQKNLFILSDVNVASSKKIELGNALSCLTVLIVSV